jgi:hypothetical protein
VQFLPVALLVFYFEDNVGQTVTMNAEWFMEMLLETFLWNQLILHELNSLWFQQGGATARSAKIYMAVLREMFPGRLISHSGDINWPVYLHDLSATDYFLWGYAKDTSCQN